MIFEEQKSWHRALDFYNDAINAAGESARFGKLLAPTPAGLYWQLARRRKKHEPAQALEDIDRALKLGVRWNGMYPERRALRDRAQILEVLRRPQDAADSYFEAGRRYSWIGKLATSLPLLERACELKPRHAAAHWQLSEVLRVLSYTKSTPFVDKDLVDRSRTHWEAGLALRRPDVSEAWVYLGRALLNEQRWALSKDPELLWESLVFLESALLLNEDYATAWAYLGQYHRVLDNLQTALDATQRALTLDPANIAGLEQRAAVLAQTSRYSEAEILIDRRLKQAEEWWVIALKAYVQLRTERAEQALELAERAAEAVPDNESYRSLRALCRRRVGQRDQSEEDYRWIWDRRDTPEGVLWQPRIVAEAGYMLGEFDEAARILQTAIERQDFGLQELWSALGQVRLARGDPARNDVTEGVSALKHAFELIRDAGQLDDLLGLDLDELDCMVAGQPDPQPAQAALVLVRALVAETRDGLSRSELTPDDELRTSGETASANSDMWLAARAGLARRASAAGQWPAALDLYVTLKPLQSFSGADIGLTRALNQLEGEADRLVSNGRIGEARERYETLLDLAQEHLGATAGITAGLVLRAGFAALIQSDDEAGQRNLTRFISVAGIRDRLDEFAAVGQSFLRSPLQYWDIVDGLRRLQDRYSPQEEEREVLDGLVRRLNLSQLYRLSAGEVTTFPMATPLALQLGPSLKPADPTGEESLRRNLAELQARVERDVGIRVPGVRVLKGTSRNGYGILIDETPVASGSVRVGECFLLSQQPDQQIAGRRDRDPLSGDWGVWADEHETRPGDAARLSPLAFVLRHLEATVRHCLPCFIGPDDVQGWLDHSPDDETALARLVLPDRSARLLLSRVLQALARERVPLTAPAVVLGVMRSARPGAGVLELTAAVRQHVRLSLPGNSPETRRVSVPQPLEEALAVGLHRENGSVHWQLPRSETTQLLARLRDINQGALAGNQTALVVRSSLLRPFVWRLVSPEFPYLSVLAEEELVEPRGEPSTSAIDVPGHSTEPDRQGA